MEQSLTLLSAQIHFLDTKLVLIHVPLHLYHQFLQPILQLVLPSSANSCPGSEGSTEDPEVLRARRPWAYSHPFVNVSVTPIECSIVCSTGLAELIFRPIIETLSDCAKHEISISEEEYVVIQVDGEGIDAGQRVLELTGPLAMNGISLFFITTYFSDYVIVPLRFRSTVISALEDRGFAFSHQTEAFVNVSSPLMRPKTSSSHLRNSSSISSPDRPVESYFSELDTGNRDIPRTPPPSSISELESRTFAMLKKRAIAPSVDKSIQLIQCAGRKDSLGGETSGQDSSALSTARLQLGLIKCLITTPRPQLISITLTDTEPASLLLEKGLLVHFGEDPDVESASCSDDSALLINREDILVPILLDLRELPLESTGIVCGVAGRLVGSVPVGDSSLSDSDLIKRSSIEMSYLSTARAGAVMVNETDLDNALAALQKGEGIL